MTINADDEQLPYALYGLIDATGHWRAGTLRAIALTADLLTGKVAPAEDAPPGTAGGGTWTRFIGRIGAVALRAAAPFTQEEHRERLLAFLDTWAATPFADPRARLRVGVVATDSWVSRDDNGAAVATYWHFSNRNHRTFVDLRYGEQPPPSLGPVVEVNDVPRGWGSAGQLRTLTELIRERGPMPWDPAAVKELTEGTGMSRAAAALVLAGVPGAGYTRSFPDATERKVMGITTAEADDARTELRRLDTAARLDLLADVLPADPAELWEPGGAVTLARRIAEQWCGRHGRRVPMPEATFAAALKVADQSMSAAEIWATFTTPAADTRLTRDVDTSLRRNEHGCFLRGEGHLPFDELLCSMPRLIRWAYGELPAGDPVRAGVPEVVRLMRERLSHPGLLLHAGSTPHGDHSIEVLRHTFGHASYPLVDHPTADDGLSIAAPSEDGRYARIFFRPACHDDGDERARLLSAVVSPYGDRSLRAFQWLRGEACERIVERIRTGALPDGRYESDPRAVLPDLVRRVAERHTLTEDAATLYLQLLALPNPNDANIRTWNGWKAPRHRQAMTALVDAALVVQDKRSRAGRTVFLPGGWASAKKLTPMETWKADLLGVTLSYDRSEVRNWRGGLPGTLPDLFTQAWQRAENGHPF
ncbi:hypothetical protein E1286_01635 [Nonomuraea terrae]|uniref:DNA-binding protein n=1 Tax=Nonomuraea terrae TaxID=2530383 RepID=A0A4R4ZF68_9ACTN|nr:hypothetical protein [Nonomuraea terrae]TDD57015.1 hypothetical protein E1286_01635 [Nonomuraea terrae]